MTNRTKTGRRRGAMLARVREVAAPGLPISALSFPEWDRRRSSQFLRWLAIAGQLRLLAPGHSGRGAPPAIYIRVHPCPSVVNQKIP